jgi:hypothetical protein
MERLRAISAVTIGLIFTCAPLFAAPNATTTPLGTVIAAERAHVGEAGADVGTTVYSGDRVSTDSEGSMQVRAGAARLLLLSSSTAIVNSDEGSPSAKLLLGTATFSTGNAHAFTLYVSTAAIRSNTDVPTIGTVTYVNDKELLVTARRGSLIVTVENEEQIVAEGTSYRVLLDPAIAQGPEGAGAGNKPQGGGGQGGPLKAGRSRFLLLTTALIAAGTGVAIYAAVESPFRP